MITNGCVVEMNYTLTNSKGEVIDSSKGRDPLAYIQGKKHIIPGLEKEMEGKNVGDKFKVTVQPEEAYGLLDAALIQPIPKSEFGAEADKVQVGMQFQVEDNNGQPMVVTAIEISENEVVLDGNHPLAGEVLYFDVEVMSLRDATEEELEKNRL